MQNGWKPLPRRHSVNLRDLPGKSQGNCSTESSSCRTGECKGNMNDTKTRVVSQCGEW